MDFKALFGLSPNSYLVVDRDQVIVWMNEAYLKVTMQTHDAIVGRPIFDAFPSEGESHDLLDSSFRRVLETGKRDEIALIKYDIRAPDGSMAERFWSATHTPLCDDDGNVELILQHTVDVTELHRLRQMRDEMGLVERADAVQARNVDLEGQTERLRNLFEQAPGFVAVLDGPNHVFQIANAAYRHLLAREDLIGKSVAEALPEIVEQGFVGILDEVFATAEPYFGQAEEIYLDQEGRREWLFLNFIYQPILGDDGAVTGIFVQGYDVTDEVIVQRQKELLLSELNHRVKNTLAVVQGLAAQSFRSIDPGGGARKIFSERLRALTAAHDLLTNQNWQPASLEDTLRTSINAATGEAASRFHLSGPDVLLEPRVAVSMAMLVHELCTNAIKYGALSVEDGHVAIDWRVDPNGEARSHLIIEWRETGGPPVVEPATRGFGSRLIEQGFVTEHEGKALLSFDPEGVSCLIELELDIPAS